MKTIRVIFFFLLGFILFQMCSCIPTVHLTKDNKYYLSNSTYIEINNNKLKETKNYIKFAINATKAGYTRNKDHTNEASALVFNSTNNNSPILLFIHGGKYKIGNKEQYNYIGKNFSKMGITTIIVDFPQGYNTNIESSLYEIWSIIQYIKPMCGETIIGNPNNINLMGHSSGGHLAALLALRDTTINHTYLLDPFGLNLSEYLKNPEKRDSKWLYKLFGNQTRYWESISPSLLDLKGDQFTIFLGGNTYSKMFYSAKSIEAKKYIISNTNHLDMVFGLQDSTNVIYKLILEDLKK